METPKKVAIIHREPALIRTLDGVFELLGYSAPAMLVHGRTTPYEVASFVRSVGPDLVLISESFEATKGGEGLEAAVEIKKESQNLPIGLVSGNPKYRERARELGIVGYLPMPGDMGDRDILEVYDQFLKQILQPQS